MELNFRPSSMLPETSNSQEPGWQPDWKEYDKAVELSAVIRTNHLCHAFTKTLNQVQQHTQQHIQHITRHVTTIYLTFLCQPRAKCLCHSSRPSVVNWEGVENLLHPSLNDSFRKILFRDAYWKLKTAWREVSELSKPNTYPPHCRSDPLKVYLH